MPGGWHLCQNDIPFLILLWSCLPCGRTQIPSGFGYSECSLCNNSRKFFRICHHCSSEQNKNCFPYSFRQGYLAGWWSWKMSDMGPSNRFSGGFGTWRRQPGVVNGRTSSTVVSTAKRCPWRADYCAWFVIDLNYHCVEGCVSCVTTKSFLTVSVREEPFWHLGLLARRYMRLKV